MTDAHPADPWPFDWTPPVAARQVLPPGPSDLYELGDGQARALEVMIDGFRVRERTQGEE